MFNFGIFHKANQEVTVTILITREAAISDYREHFSSKGWNSGEPMLLNHFPPISLYLMQKGVRDDTTFLDPFVGDPACQIELINLGERRIRLCYTGFPTSVLMDLGLAVYRSAVPKQNVKSTIEQAITNLRPKMLETISSWISVIVYLEPIQKGGLSSTSFYELPHCCFVTRFATRFLPPDTVLPVSHPYAFQENLYHEALHQWLCRQIARDPVVKAGVETSVFPSWRGGEAWPLEQAIQACFVYAHVGPFRKMEAQNGASNLALYFEQSAARGRACAKELFTLLNACHSHITSKGIEILSALEAASE
jgi:hypothetical protein